MRRSVKPKAPVKKPARQLELASMSSASSGSESDYNDEQQSQDESDHFPPKRQRSAGKKALAASKKPCVYTKPNGHQSDGSSSEEGADPIDRVPRQRKSSSWEYRVNIIKSRTLVENIKPEFPCRRFRTWEDLNEVLKDYQAEHHLRFRVRTSIRTTTHNSKPNIQRIPSSFEFYKRDFRCTHGVVQPPRGSGQRSHSVRFTGCTARFYATVVNVAAAGDPACWEIQIENETRTHNHQINKDISDSYFSINQVDPGSKVLEDVAKMIDARANTKHVNAYLSDKLGVNISSQQVRNLIRRMHGRHSAETRLKDILHAFVQVEGNEAMFMQDQMDITCGIVLQSSIQKRCFDEWGDCVVMDWTHGTNNLGFHMGSLLVTSPSGRGIPVLDFIALDEKATTMTKILEFFKVKNSNWKGIKTFIIDKDYTEWRVLEQCFPDATVLLCQFHAITYWRKLLSRQKYNLRVKQRTQCEDLFRDMIYCSTEQSFDAYYGVFAEYCSVTCPDILEYFNKNWRSCREMWSNYARSAHFSAGNTTTNRIEANWNQLKMRLGRKPRIDRTIAGLLCHQVAVLRQFSTVLRTHATRSRQPDQVPEFLHRVAARLSDYTLTKVVQQWNCFMSTMEERSCRRPNPDKKWIWEVCANFKTFTCDDIAWSCTCIFYTSTRLPCRHLMAVAKDGHRFKALPTASVHDRWCMTTAAATLLDPIREANESVLPVIAIANVKHYVTSEGELGIENAKATLNAKATEEAGATESGHASVCTRLKKRRSVAFVRLRRRERSNMVVLSSPERYTLANAMVEPLLEHLSSLSNINFYKELQLWGKIIKDGLMCRTSTSSEETTCDDEDDSDGLLDSVLAIEELDVNETISKLEKAQADADVFPDDNDRVLSVAHAPRSELQLPTIDISTQSQTTLLASQPAPDAAAVSSKPTDESSTGQVAVNNVELLRMPSPQPRNTTRQRAGVKRSFAGTRMAAVSVASDVTVTVEEIVHWASNTGGLETVKEAIEAYPVRMTDPFLVARQPKCHVAEESLSACVYNFVVPSAMVNKMQSVLTAERSKQDRANRLKRRLARAYPALEGDNDGSMVGVVVSVVPDHVSFSSRAVHQMIGFYDAKKKARAWSEDMKWLHQDWSRFDDVLAPVVELFSMETQTADLLAARLRKRHQELADNVIQRFSVASLRTQLAMRISSTAIRFHEIVGYVARDRMLNDAVIHFVCQAISDSVPGSLSLSSHVFGAGWPPSPTTSMGVFASMLTVRFVVLPVHFSILHWGVLIVELRCPSLITVNFYDPLGVAQYQTALEDKWEEGLLPYLTQWHRDSRAGYAFPVIEKRVLSEPVQSDGTSCGVFVIGQVYSTLHSSTAFTIQKSASRDYVQVMRLRILWMLMCATESDHEHIGSDERDMNIHTRVMMQLVKSRGY